MSGYAEGASSFVDQQGLGEQLLLQMELMRLETQLRNVTPDSPRIGRGANAASDDRTDLRRQIPARSGVPVVRVLGQPVSDRKTK
jgi:hypothetical protein